MKKVLALVLAVVLALGMATVGFAKSADRIKDIKAIGWSEEGQLNSITAYHNREFKIYLKPVDTLAYWTLSTKDATEKDIPAGELGNPMTTSNLTSTTVKATWKKGGEYFNTPELKYDSKVGTCYIELKTKKGITLTTEKEIDGTLYIAYKGEKLEMSIGGLAKNEEVLTGDDDSVWVKKSDYFKADDFVKNKEVNFENDEIIGHLTTFSGKKYYFWAEEDILTADEEVMAKYPSIENVYHAYFSTNVNVASTYMTFDLDENYYVYDRDGKYLGMSNEKIVLSSVYYMSTTKIEMAAGETETPAETPSETPDDTLNPGGGGDDAPTNANANPGTGANGFVNVAVVAGMVALAAAGFASKK